jgi:uncharacterized protein YdiU (UPF0061 family)
VLPGCAACLDQAGRCIELHAIQNQATRPRAIDGFESVAADTGKLHATFGVALPPWQDGLARKIGLGERRPGDDELAQDLLRRMAENDADFTLTFRALVDAAAEEAGGGAGDAAVRALFQDGAAYDGWAAGWRARLVAEGVAPEARRSAMRAANPAFIPRNHQVERAIAAGVERADFGPFEALLSVLARPFDDQPGAEDYAAPPQPEERVLATFCGT